MMWKPERLLLCALTLTLAGCFRPAGDVIEPTVNSGSITLEPVGSPTLMQPEATDAVAGQADIDADAAAATDAADPGVNMTIVPDAASPAPRASSTPAPPATDADAPDSASPAPQLAITIVPPATSTPASAAAPFLTQTAAVTTPTETREFITPVPPSGPVPREAMSAFGTEEVTPTRGLTTPTASALDADSDACVYVVEAGDNLYRIALSNNFTVAELREANPDLVGQDPILQIGQELNLPGCGVRPTDIPVVEADAADEDEAAADDEPAEDDATDDPFGATAAPPAEQIYAVRPGDTLTAIAIRFGVTVQAIVEANNLPNRDQLSVGQELIIPSE